MMIDPNNQNKDVRSSVTGDQPPAISPAGSNTGSTAKTDSAPAPTTPAGASSSTSTTVKTSTSTPISTTIPAQYTASSYADLIPEIEKRMAEFKPLSDDELKKLRRKQKIEGIISGVADAAQAVSNLIFTHHYAPNMYNPKEGMSAKAKERFDRDKKQREADADKYLQYALTLGKLKDADRQAGLEAWKTEQTLARQDRAFEAGRKDQEDAIAFRDKNFDRQDQWHKEEGERWERQFNQGVLQFNITSANERARLGLEAQRLSRSMQEGQMTFNLGSGNGNVTLTLDKLNAQTVSRIYSTLPQDVRAQVQGEPIVQNGFVVGYKEPTTEAMLIAIGANVEKSPATQNAIKQVAGLCQSFHSSALNLKSVNTSTAIWK